MGREIRKVPPHWDHPKDIHGRLIPMFDRTFTQAATDWKEGFAKWESGERPDYCTDESMTLEYWEYSGAPPNRDSYRSWTDSEATWFQVWETVSEGTPVTPPFTTKHELVDYLVQHGDFWAQRCGEGGYSVKAAQKVISRSTKAASICVPLF